MGQKVSDAATIRAPRETILEVIADLDSYPEWAEGVQEAEALEADEHGRPVRGRFKVDARVVEVSYTLAYSYEGDEVVSWELIEGETVNQLDGSYVLRPNGDGTEVTYTLEADVDIPLPGFMKKRAAKQILESGLKGLKQRAESR